MKFFLLAMLASLLSFLTGCNSIPAITADKIHYQSSYPIGGSTIDVSNVKVSETTVSIGKYKRTSRWWYVTQDVEVEGYSRERTAGEAATIKTP